MSNEGLRPIIIKKVKKGGGDGHHGGAWKVAYADFVTAMMAFFLLMWLLNATTEKQRKGIADYFAPTISINRASGGGSGVFGGDSVFTEQTLARNGTGASSLNPMQGDAARGAAMQSGEQDEPSDETMSEVENMLLGGGGESLVTENAMQHILTRVTDEGLIVELFDTEEEPLFEGLTAEPTPIMIELTAMLARVFSITPNTVAVSGHTQSYAVVMAQDPVWALSTERAAKTREMMTEAGLDPKRVQRVTGHADRKLSDDNPMSIRNNRIEVVLLRSDI